MQIYKIIFLFLAFSLFSQSLDLQIFQKAEEYFEDRDYYNAQKLYESIVNNPNLREKVLFKLSLAQYYLQKQDEAYNNLKLLLTEYPETDNALVAIRVIIEYLKNKKNYKEASSILEKYVNKYKELKNELLKFYEYQEDYNKALNYLENNFEFSKFFIEKKVEYLIALKDYKSALNFLNSINEEFKDEKIYSLLGEVYIKTGDFDKAEKSFKRAYEISKNVDYLIQSARMFAFNNRKDKAASIIESLLDIWGYEKESFERIASIYKELGLYDELLKFYDKAKRYNLDFTKEKIFILEILGKYEDAINEYINILDNQNFIQVKDRLVRLATVEDKTLLVEKIINERLKNSDPFLKEKLYQILYFVYIETSNIDKVEAILKDYVKLENVDIYFLNLFYNTLFQRKEYKSLSRIMNEIKNIKNLPASMILNYAELLYITGDYERASELLKELKTDTEKDRLNFLKAKIYFAKGDYFKCANIVKDYNDYFPSFLLYIDSLIHLGDFKTGLNYIEKEMDNKKFRKDVLYYKNGIILIFLEREGEAKNIFRKLIELYPYSEYANDVLFYLFIWDNDFVKNNEERKKNFYEFIKNYYLNNYKKAIENLNNIFVANSNLGEICEFFIAKMFVLSENYDEAIKVLEQIIKNDYKLVNAYALQILGDIYYFQKKELQKAFYYYKILLDRYPNHPKVSEIRKRFY